MYYSTLWMITDFEAAIEEFANINEDNAVSTFDGFVYEENDE